MFFVRRLQTAVTISAVLAGTLLVCHPAFSDTYAVDGTHVTISLKNKGYPASDLLYNENGKTSVLTPPHARQLKEDFKTDLSTLEPDSSSDVWDGLSHSSDEALDDALIGAGDCVNYLSVLGTVLTQTGVGALKFSVQTQVPGQSQTLTFMMHKNIHPYLLRKELLRKLGYKIPAMKYLPRVNVRFPDEATRDYLIGLISHETFIIRVKANTQTDPDPLVVTLQDVVAMEATPSIYNLALGPPIDQPVGTNIIKPEGPRILRSLVLPYALAEVSESINQFDWSVGSVSNGAITFHVPNPANFACTLDDALWMLRRMAGLSLETGLSVEDYRQIVARAYYPPEIGKIVTEKLISRRNSLVRLFKQNGALWNVNKNVGDGTAIKNGKVIQEKWADYGSDFAFPLPLSPFRQMGYYLLSEVESIALENLVGLGNAALPGLTTSSESTKHQNELTQKFLMTGQPQGMQLGLWAAPLLNGGVNLSRDIVMGNYLGTFNLLQLADNFGFYVNAGFMVGVDGLPFSLGGVPVSIGLSGQAQGTLTINFTHLKPLASLKQAVTEPINKEFVPWILKNASGIFKKAAGVQGDSATLTPQLLKQELVDDLNRLANFIGIGESVILTESIAGDEQLRASLGLPVRVVAPNISLQLDGNQLVISRLRFFRQDATTLLVYQDNGLTHGGALAVSVSAGTPEQLPLVTVNLKKISGPVKSEIFMIDITADPQKNPLIYQSSAALCSSLRTGSVEALEQLFTPTRLSTDFKDRSRSLQALHYIHRTLKTDGTIEIRLPDGTDEHFVALNDGVQKGAHYQKLFGQVGSFLAQLLTKDSGARMDIQAASDPGTSYLGHSETRNAEFQARLDGGVKYPFVRVKYRWEGWDISREKATALAERLSQQYGFKLFNDDFLFDTTNIKLYQLALSMDIYEAGLKRILAMSPDEEAALIRSYVDRCFAFKIQVATSAACRGLNQFERSFARYRKTGADDPTLANLTFQIASNLEKFASFQDFLKIVGQDNLYISADISGFRMGSEQLSTPLHSNTLGLADSVFQNGVLSSAQGILGIDNGEFYAQWLRDSL